jgi:toxin ParE1/3/4
LTIVWTASALNNLTDQLEYVAEDNPSAAARLEMEIERQIHHLATHPHMGRPGRVRGTRELVITRTPYIAIYRISSEAIQILRLLHGAQKRPE